MRQSITLATADAETDPFKEGRVPSPFAWGFSSRELGTSTFWGNKATQEFLEYVASIKEPHRIHVHNGGRFDFYFLMSEIFKAGAVRMIGSRIAEWKFGQHIFRDSICMMPMPLSRYKKDDIDYGLFERSEREKHKPEIISYLRSDCEYLLDMVEGFNTKNGPVLTCGSAAIKRLSSKHAWKRLTPSQDGEIRPFFFGGRVQCFRVGHIEAPVKLYDLNSAYPDAMAHVKHPVTAPDKVGNKITKDTVFATIVAKNYGALPLDIEGQTLRFDVEHGTFNATIHEIEAGLETGTLEIEQVISTYDYNRRVTFQDFIYEAYAGKEHGKATGNIVEEILAKFDMNSAYGKFATNPENFFDHIIVGDHDPEELKAEGWALHEVNMGHYIYRRKAPGSWKSYLNVATGASITGATRAKMLRGLAKATEPLYCDTDSIFCRELDAPIHHTKLGFWDLEKEGDAISIGGKKTYALWQGGVCVKQATKGARLTSAQIKSVALGEIVEHISDVPTFKLSGKHSFMKRRIRATQKDDQKFGRVS